MLKKIQLIAMAFGLLGGVSSCKKMLDVNTNPNVSQTASVKTLLPAGQLYLATAVGVDLQIYGAFWSQYWTSNPSSSQYLAIDQYAPTQDAFNTAWNNLYAANENFYQLQMMADSQHLKAYEGIAILLQAYTFQLITDGWGDVPYKEALKGQFSTGHISSPHYDSQLVVYKGLIANIDTAVNYLSAGGGTMPSGDDLVYGGNLTQWQKFANTLKLKIYLRMSVANPTYAQTGLTNLYAQANHNFLGLGDDAKISFGFNSNNLSPLYSEESGIGKGQNFVASATCLDSMVANHDTVRLKVFYTRGAAAQDTGLPQGNSYGAIYGYSIPSSYVGGNMGNSASGNAPVNLMTSYESLFMQAEAVARGMVVTGINDHTLFLNAIQANFLYYNNQITAATGISGSTAYSMYVSGTSPGHLTQYPTTGSVAQRVRYIILQKWMAMCGNQSFEAWSDLRRTGLDSTFATSATSVLGSLRPKRFLYPSNESMGNGNFPGLQPITKQVWWDLY
jgi:Starch-binding associating with outer membrane